jgi:hypothetical protein
MQPNLRRFLPLIIIVFFLLIVLPTLLRKGSSSGPTAKTLSQETIAAMSLVDRAELDFKAEHGRYSGHLADLLGLSRKLGANLVDGVAVTLDVSTDGQTYVGRVASNVISLVRARQGGKTITHGCLVVKSGSGVACPAAAPKPAGTTTAETTTSTSSSTG